MTSQFVDTILFISIAFGGTVPGKVLLGMIATQYVFKFGVAVIDTPLAYLLVKLARRIEPNSEYESNPLQWKKV